MKTSEMTSRPKSPVVLCFSARDATGASGMTADIEAIVSQGCHASTVITCLSVQDSQMVSSLIPISVCDVFIWRHQYFIYRNAVDDICLTDDLPAQSAGWSFRHYGRRQQFSFKLRSGD